MDGRAHRKVALGRFVREATYRERNFKTHRRKCVELDRWTNIEYHFSEIKDLPLQIGRLMQNKSTANSVFKINNV